MPGWTTMNNLTTGDLVTEADMDAIRSNIEYLHAANHDLVEHVEGTSYTTTSTTFVDVDAADLAQTLTTTGGNVLVLCTLVVSHPTAGARVEFDLEVDGARQGQDFGLAYVYGSAITTQQPVALALVADGLSAAAHTFKLQWRVSGGTATLYSTSGTTPVVFHVIEL